MAASLAATFAVILLANPRIKLPSSPTRPATPPIPEPSKIMSRFSPLYSCALIAISSARLSSTPTSLSAFFVSSYMVPLTVPAPITAPSPMAVAPATVAAGIAAGASNIEPSEAIMTGALVPSA